MPRGVENSLPSLSMEASGATVLTLTICTRIPVEITVGIRPGVKGEGPKQEVEVDPRNDVAASVTPALDPTTQWGPAQKEGLLWTESNEELFRRRYAVGRKAATRSRASFRSRLAALDRGPAFFGGFKTKDVMEKLHLDHSAIRRLERKRILVRARGRITEESMKVLCREHPQEIPFETLSEETKQTLIDDYQYGTAKRAQQGGRKKRAPDDSNRQGS